MVVVVVLGKKKGPDGGSGGNSCFEERSRGVSTCVETGFCEFGMGSESLAWPRGLMLGSGMALWPGSLCFVSHLSLDSKHFAESCWGCERGAEDFLS